jgi:hypothetical protein
LCHVSQRDIFKRLLDVAGAIGRSAILRFQFLKSLCEVFRSSNMRCENFRTELANAINSSEFGVICVDDLLTVCERFGLRAESCENTDQMSASLVTAI